MKHDPIRTAAGSRTAPTARIVKLRRALGLLIGLATGIAVVLAGYGGKRTDGDAEMVSMIATIRDQFKDVKQLTPTDLATWLADRLRPRPQILDVREPQEYAVSHLPGAIRISPDATADEVLARIDLSRPVVAYCSVGYRSAQLIERLQRAGLTDVVNLEGSIFAWANEGRPLEKDGKAVKTVHPYNTKFGLMLHLEHRAP